MKFFLLLFLFITNVFASPADLRSLSEVGRIIQTNQTSYKTDPGWLQYTKLMEQLHVFDDQVKRILEIMCSNDTNKSVLLIGDTDATFKYYFARLAMMKSLAGCLNNDHVEIIASKLQGFMYVGTSERLWNDKIVRPAYEKDVILYFPNLSQLIGIGTHMNQDTGLESNYAEAISTGKLKSVAFLNKYDYARLGQSRHAYVLNSFKEKIVINEVDLVKMNIMVRTYFDVFAKGLEINDKVLAYLFKMSNYYRPNVGEPTRTLGLVESILRKNQSTDFDEKELDIATPNPYPNNHAQTDIVEFKNAKAMALVFDYFRTEYAYDTLNIYDANTNQLLETYSGNKMGFTTEYFKTSKLRLVFNANRNYSYDGYKISKVVAKINPIGRDSHVTYEDVRNAVMEVVQIPKWIVRRDYKVVKELPKKLDGELVGVVEGKRDLIGQIKIGYVAGRTDTKPAGALMFVGPTGTGKSYLAKKSAEFMGMKLITMDMTQYATDETFDRFLDTLSKALTVNPYSFFLFEEIDKANVKVLDRLYFMLDEGIFYDKNQAPLYARGAFIMMTTNAAHKVITDNRHSPDLRTLVNRELQKYYRPSFLNRFDAISIFLPFTDEEYYGLAQILTAKKTQLMTEFYDWKITVDDGVLKYIGKNGHSVLYGARPMERTIEKVLSIGISNFQLEHGTLDFGAKIRFSKLEGRDDFSITVNSSQTLSYTVPLSNNQGFNKVLLAKLYDPFGLNYLFLSN